MASMSIFIGKALPKPFGSDPGSGVFSAAIALVVAIVGVDVTVAKAAKIVAENCFKNVEQCL